MPGRPGPADQTVTVAAGEYGGDDQSDFATGAGAGAAPRVRVFDGTGAELFSFLAFDAGFSGGVFVG